MNKKKTATAAFAIVLAVILAVGGGTLAYYSYGSVGASNNISANFNWVALTETDGKPVADSQSGNITNSGFYEIVPGTSQDKNPVVKVSYSVNSYVYVVIEDNTGKLTSWQAAPGWSLLSDSTDSQTGTTTYIYYRLVTTDDEVEETKTDSNSNVTYYKNSFSVLKDDVISYSASLSNSDTIESVDSKGNVTLKSGLKLTVQAYIIQASPFADAQNAYLAISGNGVAVNENTGVVATTLEAAVSAAKTGNTITLLDDCAVSGTLTLSSNIELTLNLDGHSLTNSVSDDGCVLAVSKGSLTVADTAGGGGVIGNLTGQAGVLLSGGSVTVSGGTVSGSAGIITTGGTLNITGGAVAGLSTNYETMDVYYANDGETVSAYKDRLDSGAYAVNGSGIIVAAGADSALKVNISGGEISTADYENNYDLCVVQMTGEAYSDYGVCLNITGGTFGGDAAEAQNYYLACDWGNESNNDYEYSWIELNISNVEIGGVCGKYFTEFGSVWVTGSTPF
ncbi:MAG: autotransporter adhesin family protein [Clostridiales bacterium]|nr:autotransporter adhesin family protein [Clostridiales bacterium]